jgi:hypothetical protein
VKVRFWNKTVKFRDTYLKFFQKTETICEVLISANYNKENFWGVHPLKRPILKFHARRSFEDLLFERDEKSCRGVLAWRACMYSQYRVGLSTIGHFHEKWEFRFSVPDDWEFGQSHFPWTAQASKSHLEPPGKTWSGRFSVCPSTVHSWKTDTRPTVGIPNHLRTTDSLLPSVEFSQRLKSTAKYVEPVTLLLVYLGYY